MNKKGFTLVELLGVIILIALITLLSFPSILNHIEKAQNTIDKTTEELVINATKDYVSDNLKYFPKVEGNVFCVNTKDLLNKKYLDKTIIEENKTLENKIVEIKYLSQYKYSIVDKCEGVNIEIPDEEINHPENILIFDFDEATGTIKGFKEGIDASLYSNLVIPGEINGVEVKKIAANAFKSKGLTSLTLAPTITSIGEYAFYNNKISNSLDLSNVSWIGSYAFQYNKISGVTFSNKITSINSYTFANNALVSLKLPGNIKTINALAFSFNLTLTSIQLEEGIQKIGGYAFRNHSASELTIPGSVTTIDTGAFDGVSTPPRGNLKKVTVEEGTSAKGFAYHIFNGHWPTINVHVDLESGKNKYINWNYVINNNSNESSAVYCDGTITQNGQVKCIYE